MKKKKSQRFWWREIPDPEIPQKPILVCPQCGGKYIKSRPRQKKCAFCIEGKPYPFYQSVVNKEIE